MVVTGDTSRQLSPIVASEVSTDDDGKTRLVTYNKNGGVVSDREYRDEKAAKEAQEKIGHEQDENLTQALQQNVYAKDADSVMKEAYDAAAQVYNNGGSLNTGQRTLIYLYQHKPQLDKALQAMTSGEPLSDEDRKLVNLLNTVQGTLYKMNGTVPRIANNVEEDYGLGTDGLKAAREGHTEKEAKKISAETGEEIVHVGGDVWRTRNEDAAVKEYQRRLFDYSTNVEEGKDVEMPEPKGLPGKAEGEAAQSTAPNGTEPPTDGEQPPIGEQQPDEQQGPVDQQQPVEGRQSTTEEETPADQQPPTDQQQQGEGQPSKVQQIRAQGRERGSAVMDDETLLDQLQYESDYANQRLDNAFPDGEMSDFRDGLVKAVDDGDDDAIQALLDRYDSRLSQEQKDAAINYVESAGAMEGIDDTIVAKTQQYQAQRKEELDRISDHNGNITTLTLADGSKLYYISGDLTNEYGGVIATNEWGKRQQIPVSSITGVGEVQSSQAILDNDTNNYAAAVEKHFMDMANGRKMITGQRTTINIGGEDVNAVCDGTLDDGTVVLALEDGSKIHMSPDELSQTRAAARKASVDRNLAEADNLREMQAREERFKNGIDNYGTFSVDIGGENTKPEIAAEYLHEQDKKNGTDSKATLKDMEQTLKTVHFNERQGKRAIEHLQSLLSVDDEGSEEYDLHKQRIEQRKQQLAEDQRRQRKIAEVRNAYMTPKEKQQMKMERMGAIDKARKAAEEERRNVLRRTGQSEEEQVKVEGIDSKSLLGKYKTQAEADAALQQQRDTIMKDYRDGAGTAIADIQNQLREYGDGLRELDDDELSDLSSRLVEAQQQEKRAIEQAKQIKAAQQRLPLTYKDRNKEEVDKLSPREKRAHILQGARDPQDLLRRAREAYADSDMVGRLDDLEPGGVQTRGSEGQAPLRGEEPDKSHAPLEDHAQQSDDRGTTAAAAGNSSADRGILVPEGAQGVRLNKDQVTSLLKNMEDNAETSTELELTPETWSAVFDENNSTNTPLGRVKMGEGQIMKFFIKGRTKEFGMVGPTLNDPDVIIEEPSEAKDGNSERASSYIFVKTFNRNGEKIKFYASVTVKKDGMEVSISSHYMNPSAVSRRILENNVIYIRKALIPNSSDGHLAEHRNGVPDLLPTQGNNAYSDAKVEKTSGSIGKKSEKVAEGERNSDNSAAAEQRPTEPSGTGSIGTTDSPEKVESERQSVNTEPTEGQKEAGNYKKGHIKVDGYDITIENPKGSTRSGKDASGKAWSVPMHYDYGYIKGTEGVDGDHIDVYLSDDPTKGNVYVVDQVNQNDGSFDEHKVMYGFPSMEAAIAAYKGQYEDGWKVGTVTEVSREDFKKWVESSKRKTKPFADYKSMETAAKQQRTEPSVPDIKPIGSGNFGPIYDQFKDKPNEAIKFLMSQKDGEALGALHHKEIGAISIVWGNAKAGLQKIAHKHPEVLGNLQEILDGMHVVRSSDNRVKLESGTHFAVVSRDWLGKEHTPWLLTAFEKKESSANNNSMDTAETLDGKRNDTATPRDTAFNGKDSKKNNTKQEKGEKNGTTQPLTDINSVMNEIETRQYIAKYATMKAAELRKREPDELLTLERKELAQADTNERLAKIAKGEKRDKLLNDVKAHRANAELAKRVREEKEKEAKDIWGFHRAPSRVGRLTKREIALRDALNDAVRETGIEVIEDVEEGQRVLDMANDALLSKSKKRALETASLGTSSRSLTAISSADGAKVLKGLDNLVNKCENSSTQPKTFIGEVADALGIPRENFKDKSSRYATFE